MRFAVAFGAGLGALVSSFTSWAQAGVAVLGAEQSTTAFASPSTRPVPVDEQLWRKAVWHSLDLREKANKPLFAQGHWVTSVIIAAVKRGELVPYRTDSCTRAMTVEEFRARLHVPGATTAISTSEADAGFTDADLNPGGGWPTTSGTTSGAAGRASSGATSLNAAPELLPRQLYQLEIKEQLIFDKRRARMRHLMEALTITIPASETAKNYDAPLASFRYDDLVRVFRAHPDEAIWFNTQNSAQHKNLADAFDLWLFSSRITKVENPDDKSLAELSGSERAGLFAGQEAAGKLIEFEDQLWSR